MKLRHFKALRDLIYEHSGIHLSNGKEALVSNRLGRRMRQLGIQDFGTYLEYMGQNEDGDELVQLLDAISTNVTSFFREADHFEFIQRRMMEWFAGGQRRFRLWSAACSTGEEPYSLAMCLEQCDLLQRADIRILATDISTRVLSQAKEGIYSETKLQPVPAELRREHFHPARKTEGAWQLCNAIRGRVIFRRLNLAETPFPMKGPLDAVFCRNVMIYFDNKVRRELLAEIYRLLKPGGLLLVGHAESLMGLDSNFKAIQPSIYLKSQ